MIKIAVFCNTGSKRAKLLATKFTQQGVCFFRWQNQDWEKWDNESGWTEVQPKQKHVHILFWHTGDLNLEDHRPPGADYHYCVKFSTTGVQLESEDRIFGIPERFPNPENDTTDTCPLSDSDIKEFIDWASNQRSSPPDICLGRKTAEIRAALFILCDAYLQTYNKEIHPKLSEAEEERLLPCDPKWWQKALCQQRPQADNLPQAVNCLLDEIFNEEPPSKIDHGKVENAYQSLQ